MNQEEEKFLADLRAKTEAEMKAAEDIMNSSDSSDSIPTPDPAAATAAAPQEEKVEPPFDPEPVEPPTVEHRKSALDAVKGAAKTHFTSAEKGVQRFNEKYALVHMGKDTLIRVDKGDGDCAWWTVKTFELHEAWETVPQTTQRGTKDIPLAEVWLKSPDRKTYNSVDFIPFGDVPDDVLNLWSGFGVKSIPDISFKTAARGCHKLLRHIRENLCKGSREEYRYFMRWCANMIQRPHIKGGVAVSIYGRKGTGKTKVAEALQNLLGRHAIPVSQSSQLIGNFNAHLAEALLVVAEEAIWAGDKHADSQLKHMITSSNLALEKKGVDVVPIKSFARIMFIGNNQWMFPADEDERRLFALECGDNRKGDTDYFRDIDLQLYDHLDGYDGNPKWREAIGIRSFLTFLLQIDLSKFNIRKIPETSGLRSQRQSSMEPHAKYFYELLENRTIGFLNEGGIDYIRKPAEWLYGEERVITKAEIYGAYENWHRKHFRSQLTNNNAFWKWVKKVFGWSVCRVGGKGFQEYAVCVHGWKQSADSFVAAMKVAKFEDLENY